MYSFREELFNAGDLKIFETSCILNPNILKETTFKPVCRGNVSYIVSIILINSKNEICLIQEAKNSCRGKWYIPAGRMENYETLVEAVKREAREECGFEVDPINLCLLEINQNCTWFRFTFTGKIVGGSLKTVKQADRESIQAGWFDIDYIKSKDFKTNLRSSDFINSANVALDSYRKFDYNSFSEIQIKRLPEDIPKADIQFSFLVVDKDSNSFLVYNEKSIPSFIVLPHCIQVNDSLNYVITQLLEPTCFQICKNRQFNVDGAISVKYNGHSSCNGIEITYLVNVLKADTNDLLLLKDNFKWKQFNHSIFLNPIDKYELIQIRSPV